MARRRCSSTVRRSCQSGRVSRESSISTQHPTAARERVGGSGSESDASGMHCRCRESLDPEAASERERERGREREREKITREPGSRIALYRIARREPEEPHGAGKRARFDRGCHRVLRKARIFSAPLSAVNVRSGSPPGRDVSRAHGRTKRRWHGSPVSRPRAGTRRQFNLLRRRANDKFRPRAPLPPPLRPARSMLKETRH